MQLERRKGFGDATAGATDSFDWSSLTNLLPALLTGAAGIYTQQQLLDYNKNAAANGLPLLTASQMQTMMQSARPGVTVGVSQQVQSIVEYGLLGAGALAVLYMFMRRAR